MNPKTKLVVILGSEIDCEHNKIPGYSECGAKNKLVNKLVEEKLTGIANIEFINITSLITSQNDFTNCTNHYKRIVYYKLAQEIIKHFPANTVETKCSKITLIVNLISLYINIFTSNLKRIILNKRKIHYIRKVKIHQKEISNIKMLLKNL